MAKFKTDENLPMEVAELLSANGHDAMTRSGNGWSYRRCTVGTMPRRRAGNRYVRPGLRRYPCLSAGRPLWNRSLRLERQDKPYVMEVFERLVPKFDDEPLAGKLWIVNEETIRIRG